MRLRKSYLIKVRVGHEFREGIIVGFGYKNGERIVDYETLEGTPYWCYRSQIVDVRK